MSMHYARTPFSTCPPAWATGAMGGPLHATGARNTSGPDAGAQQTAGRGRLRATGNGGLGRVDDPGSAETNWTVAACLLRAFYGQGRAGPRRVRGKPSPGQPALRRAGESVG